MNLLRAGIFAIVLALGSARSADADWLFTPFIGATTHTDTGFFDLDGVARRTHATYGVGLTLFPDGVLGTELESSWAPSVFTGHDLIESSRVVSGTASVLFALPKRFLRVVRPYATLGAGIVHVVSTDIADIFPTNSIRPAASAAAGAWIPVTPRLGARAAVRYVRSVSGSSANRFRTWQISAGATIGF